MTIKVLITFGPGQYSKNKEKIKQVFNLLGYKYASGSPRGEQLICTWKRKPEGHIIKALFNGSGKACQFTVECNEDEREAFESLAEHFQAGSKLYNEDSIDSEGIKKNSIDSEGIKKIAKEKVDKWFTWLKQEKGEPDLFYTKRIEKMNQSYIWFVEQEIKRIKELL